MAVSEYLVTDDLTVLLGLIAATVFLVQNLYKPQPLVHPILLGRQSDAARVRNPGESAVYRNYGTGLMGRFPVRPEKDVHLVQDFVKADTDTKTLWSTRISNNQLQDRAASFGTGLLRLAGLQPVHSNVLLLLNDSIEFLISDLALASHSMVSVTVSKATLLSPVLDAYPPSAIITHADLLHHVLELIYDSDDDNSHTVIVVGEPSPQTMASVASKIKVLRFEDVEREGMKVAKVLSPPPKSGDVFTVSFFSSETDQLHGAQITHENLTAGVAASKALFPTSNAVSSLDTIISGHSLSSPYGRCICYSAVFEGASFATLDSCKVFNGDGSEPGPPIIDWALDFQSIRKYPLPSPTILYSKPDLVKHLVTSIEKEAKASNMFYGLARRHKVNGIMEGFITKDSLWDRIVFDKARAKVLGTGAGTLRTIVVGEGFLDASLLTPARMLFSIPFVNVFSHPLASGPVLSSHPLDLQDFPQSNLINTPVGPPSANVEAKLIGVDDEVIENSGDPQGKLLVRGPPIGKLYGMDDYVSIPAAGEEEGWTNMGVHARVHANGTFRVLL